MPCKDANCLGCDGFNLDQVIQEKIVQNGCAAVWITEGPQFCYTVGLTESYQHPELIVTAQLGTRFNEFLATAVEHIEQGIQLEHVTISIRGVACEFKPVNAKYKNEMMVKAGNRYGEQGFSALQMLVGDLPQARLQ